VRDEWFCSGPEGRTGPLTLRQLKAALARHPHADDIYIWHEGFPDWVRAGDFGGIHHIRPPGPMRGMPPQHHFSADLPSFHNFSPKEVSYMPGTKRFSKLGVTLGALLIILGCVVFYLGATAQLGIVTETLDLDSDDINSYAGVFFVIAGLIVIWLTRYRVK
jgi:GYF domain 2